jgi:hypothetical protein
MRKQKRTAELTIAANVEYEAEQREIAKALRGS